VGLYLRGEAELVHCCPYGYISQAQSDWLCLAIAIFTSAFCETRRSEVATKPSKCFQDNIQLPYFSLYSLRKHPHFLVRIASGFDYQGFTSFTYSFIEHIPTFNMSVVSLLGVKVLQNPAKFSDPYHFEITFECLEQLQKGKRFFLVTEVPTHC